ncbi:unnamed protein product [Medioppia subpectinata]|uniref:glutathione transferase n=1 Tax=Medioppia subpectinata TaxID=1979941 RepID=A0A7R9QHA2_9ACAR|nr:unnamed protein product [Medioppia subpectinata]CAG2120778.1 unnamed protein product [Medioppia subpectinata]
MTQSLTILRYLARKHGLAARDEPRQARQELVEQQVLDVRQGFVSNILMNKDYETKRADYLAATLEPQLDLLVKFLGDKQWLIGGQLSYVDFLAYDVLDWLKRFTPDTIGKYPTIGQYLDRFEALPAITAYQKSPQHKAWPIFGPRASWGAVQM